MLKKVDNYIMIVTKEYKSSLSAIDTIESFKDPGRFKLLFQIASIIQITHKKNIITGAIKPSNILITDDGRYLLSDIGMYLLYEGSNNTVPINYNNISYYPPEVLENKQLNKSGDIWSLGVLMYFIFCGKSPFEGPTLHKLIKHILKCSYPPLKVTLAHKITPILEKMLLLDSKMRLTIDEVIKEIKDIKIVDHLSMAIPPAPSLNEGDCYFIEDYKHDFILICNKGRSISKMKHGGGYPHCYMNITMICGIYHYQFQVHGSIFVIGATTNNHYEDPINRLKDEKNSLSLTMNVSGSTLGGGLGVKVNYPSRKLINGGKYEIMFDMDEHTVWIQYEDGYQLLLFKNVVGTLYPFVCLYNKDNSIDIVKYSLE